MKRVDTIVIGAGILGLAAAYHLAGAGVETLVLERGEPGRGASGAGAGGIQLGIRRRQLAKPGGMAAALPMLALQAAAAKDWAGLEAELGRELGVHLVGGVMITEEEADLPLLEQKVEVETAAGLRAELLDREQLRRLCPAVTESAVAAVLARDDGYGDSLRLPSALLAAATARGAHVWSQQEVVGLDPAGGRWRVTTAAGAIESRRVVVAAGAWTGGVARLAGVELPCGGYVMQACVTERRPPLFGMLLSHLSRPVTLKQAAAGNVIIGGSWPGSLGARRAETRPESIRGNLFQALSVIPGLAGLHLIRAWAGVNPSSDGLPTVGECPGAPGLFVLQPEAGYSLGFTLGRLLAELVQGESPSLPVAPFSPARFLQ